MKFVAQLLAFTLTTSALALSGTESEASACTPAEALVAKGLRSSLAQFVEDKKFAEADGVYTKLVAMDAACIVPHDHSLGGIAARKLGNLHNAYLRFTTGGDQAGIADLNKAYGKVRIMNAANAPSPRSLNWVGIMVTTPESRAVMEESKRQVIQGGKSVLYLPPGKYFIKSGAQTLLQFDVKAGDEQLLEYK